MSDALDDVILVVESRVSITPERVACHGVQAEVALQQARPGILGHVQFHLRPLQGDSLRAMVYRGHRPYPSRARSQVVMTAMPRESRVRPRLCEDMVGHSPRRIRACRPCFFDVDRMARPRFVAATARARFLPKRTWSVWPSALEVCYVRRSIKTGERPRPWSRHSILGLTILAKQRRILRPTPDPNRGHEACSE